MNVRTEVLRRSHRRRPALELLEGRTLLSLAGSPDLTFGTDGYTSVPAGLVPFGGAAYDSTASVLQPNGDLVEVGEMLTSNDGGTLTMTVGSFYAVRYTASGAFDSAFNTTGPSLGQGATIYGDDVPAAYTGATGVALQSDGKILVVGDVNGDAKLIRLNTDGTFDTTFGTDGVLSVGSVGDSTTLGYVASVAVLPGGQIALSGAVQLTSGQDTPAVEVLNADGTIDTSFGTNGLAVVALPANAQDFLAIAPVMVDFKNYSGAGVVPLAVQPDGEIDVVANAVATGTGSTEVVAARFTAAGAVDTTFGTGGETTITPQSILPDSTSLYASTVALQPDGKLVIGGSFPFMGLNHMAVIRLGTNGLLDDSFGIGGVNILAQDSGAGAYASVGAIAFQADGKIVVANSANPDFARLDTDGLPDVTFGGDGHSAIYDNLPALQAGPLTDSRYRGTVGLAITSDGNILATEDDNGGGLYLRLAKGAVNDFDGDGISDRSIYITSLGDFAYTPSSGGVGPVVNFGPAGVGQSLPAPGAYDGEGIDELAIYSPAFGAFAIMPLQGGAPVLAPFGIAGAGNTLPAPGDYDASGATELGVYLVNQGIYAYRPANGGGDVYVSIGKPGAGQSIPAPADYFGTGQDDVAVYEPSTASYVIRDPANGQTYTVPFGIPGAGNSIPVPGDYDGSGYDELAVYLPSLGDLIYRPADGGPDVIVSFGIPGAGITLPAPGDYDGSGKTEVAAYLPTLGIFAYRPADGGSDVYENIGIPNQTIPYTLASATDAGGSGSPSVKFAEVSASVEIPLTQDVLDALAGPTAKKKPTTISLDDLSQAHEAHRAT